MGLGPDAYIRMLKRLLPPGKAFNRATDGEFHKLCAAVADEMSRLDDRVSTNLTREIDPANTFELLTDWERVVGLPDTCSADVASSIAQRRLDIIRKLSDRGGQSKQFFIDLAAVFGYAVTIRDKLPFRSGYSRSGDQCFSEAWTHHWIVSASDFTTQVFRSGQSVSGDRLRTWRNDTLECVMNQKKPAQTKVHFFYGG